MRLQFSTKVSQVFSGKRQVYKGLARADIPENRQWAGGIERQYQLILIADAGLLDSSLAKYFNIKQLATIIQLVTVKLLSKLGELRK